MSTAFLYMCTSVLPAFDKVTNKGDVRLNLLQLVAEMSACTPPSETVDACTPSVYDLLMVGIRHTVSMIVDVMVMSV